MKNYKQLIIGILIGAVGTMSITALAEYIVNPNSFPITVNGQPVDLEGYNINDRTYFQLRDIGDKVGFGVDFQDGTIQINVAGRTPKPTPTAPPAPTPIPISEIPPAATSLNPKLKGSIGDGLTSDGIPFEIVEGVKYVYTGNIDDVYDVKAHGYRFGTTFIVDAEYNVMLDNMVVNPETYDIELTYYETVLRPWLLQYCK